MKTVYVIHETDRVDGECSIIGIADSSEKAGEMLDEFYGVGEDEKVTKSNFIDIRDSGLEYSVDIEVKGRFGGSYRVLVMDYQLNSL